MTWKYQEVEDALAKSFNIQDRDRGKFRARLRHFRNLGIPEVDQPGKGQAVDFSEADLCELVVALALARSGMSPAAIRKFITMTRNSLPKICRNAIGKDQPVYVAIFIATFGSGPGEQMTVGLFDGSLERVLDDTVKIVDGPTMRPAIFLNLTAQLSRAVGFAQAAAP